MASALSEFQWSRQPAAEAVIRAIVDDFLGRCPFAADLAERLRRDTGTRFSDWIDTIELPQETTDRQSFLDAGFLAEERDGLTVLRNPHGIFPRIVLDASLVVALQVDSVADFLAANQLETSIQGDPAAPFRKATIADGEDLYLEVVERDGWHGFHMAPSDPKRCVRAVSHFERFRRRRRDFADDAAGFRHATRLIESAIDDLGADQTCALFFAAEREFWQRRNRAAQVQKARQDRLGLGWGNHDHHTYRSSRRQFTTLIALWEELGLECRERFYAGREAGWGAQVMENPRAGIVTFNDVDLAPEELLADFAHDPLPPRDSLGTIGLWCGLHGEAFLQAGMHHLECRFDFEALKEQLEREHHITVMKPFTDYPYLRQAFTEGERWSVAEERLQRLLAGHLITAEQAAQFRAQGAIGSHLENLERNEGYKGFNQKGVSEIIAATDPRRQVVAT